VVAELIRPFMPGTAERTLRMLGVEPSPTAWASLHAGLLTPGTRLGELAALFPRIEHSVEELRQMAADTNDAPSTPGSKTNAIGTPVADGTRVADGTSTAASSPSGAAVVAPAPASPPPAAAAGERIGIEDFMKVELRVAKVLAAERVPKSAKLLKLHVDTGADQRTIMAGIAESYEPEALIGRSIVIVANLKPAKLMGIESNGMVLAASPEGGKAMLLNFEEPPAPGTRVR
jgi:methionyl-tRNA synthetase